MANFSTGLKRAILGNGVDEKSFISIMENCVMAIYASAVLPANADAAEVGTLLGYVTKGGLAFTPGSPDNGINFEVTAQGLLVRPELDEWSVVPIADGAVKYLRVYDNSRILGASTSARRFDLSAGVTTGDVRFLNINLITGSKVYARDVAIDLFA